MPRDAPQTSHHAGTETIVDEAERIYRCARCRSLVTRGRWEIAMDGAHERSVFNPAGIVFRIACFREAPGVAAVGSASGDFTWFRGCLWRIGLCRSCGAHLGWMFEGAADPPVFFGLITTKLVVGND